MSIFQTDTVKLNPIVVKAATQKLPNGSNKVDDDKVVLDRFARTIRANWSKIDSVIKK